DIFCPLPQTHPRRNTCKTLHLNKNEYWPISFLSNLVIKPLNKKHESMNACRTLMFLKLITICSCAFVTVVISLDRQAAILKPLYINKAKKRNKVMLSVAWTMSVVLSMPQVKDILSAVQQMQLHRCKNNIPKACMHTLKMTVVIVLSFMVCWTPYIRDPQIWPTRSTFLQNLETVSQSLSHILFIFGLLNACLDPIIYGLFTIPCRAFELENINNSLMTSIRTSTSSLTLKRLTYLHRIGGDGAKNDVAFACHSSCME
uniref:G-protein coupled receptors family 1 profile domain-containing protein n=1 Tax=Cyprinus carpio TaxID=7962 RepID=A0A8C1KAT0_CYPCA